MVHDFLFWAFIRIELLEDIRMGQSLIITICYIIRLICI